MKKTISILFCLCWFLTSITRGQSTITFDDLSGGVFGPVAPPAIIDGYNGFNWENFYTLNTANDPLSGFVNGTVSPNNVAVGGYLAPSSFNASTPFIFVSGFLRRLFKTRCFWR